MNKDRWLTWFDRHGLFAISLFLLFFIPLFPKLPLLDAIPGYLVRVRLEDFLVLFAGVIWVMQIFRGKIAWNNSYLWLVGAYAVVGLGSILAAALLVTSVPLQPVHLAKSALHYFRYLEYFSLFFFTYSGVKTKTHLKIVAASLAVIVLAVAFYGLGQKYWGWPVYSTMNREFSKGIQLQLTEFARVQSTFAGHYDLAAFLVLVLPLLLALAVYVKSVVAKIGLAVVQLSGIAMLLLSGSKTAFIAYAAGLITLAVLLIRARPKWWKPLLVASGAVISTMVVAVILALTIFKPAAINLLTRVKNSETVKQNQTLALVATMATNIVMPVQNQAPTEKPSDVYVDVPDYVRIASQSATGEKYFIIEERERTWSKNAQKYGLSMAIRLDTLWPQAVTGFLINPYLGKGYGTLNKLAYNEFTEADSTDNNFLRTLGETGILGFIVFYSIVFLSIRDSSRNLSQSDLFYQVFSQGFIAGTAGLLVNALIIDVFTASKVAFTFWALAGFAVASCRLAQPTEATQLDEARRRNWLVLLKKHGVVILVGLFLGGLIHQYPFADHSLVKNMEIDPNQVAHAKMATCLTKNWQWAECYQQLTTNRQISPLYLAVIMPWYLLHHDPTMFFFSNVLLALAALGLFYRLCRKLLLSQWQINFALALYVLNPWTYQYPLSPVSSNLLLPLLLLLALILLNTKLPRRKWYLIGLALLVGSAFAGINHSLLLLLVPVLALLIANFNRLTPIRLPQKFQLMMGAVLLISLTIWPIGIIQRIVQNFRYNAPVWRYLAVKRANILFSTPSELDKQPSVITVVNPDYIDLFSNQLYQVLPLTNDPLTHQSLIKSDQRPVYLTNADVTPRTQAWFNAMRQVYQLQLVEIDCQYQCDFYRIWPEPLSLSTQPVSINQRPLAIEESQSVSFLSYNHQFKQADPPSLLIPPYITSLAVLKLLPLIEQPVDLAFLAGDLIDRQDAGQYNYFMKKIGQVAPFPIVHIPGQYQTQNLFNSGHQAFQIGSSYFITINPQADGAIGLGQEIFIKNELLKLEKHPEITAVYVFYYGLGWLTQQPGLSQLSQLTQSGQSSAMDKFVAEMFLPGLISLADKKIFIISGDIQHPTSPSLLYDQLPNSNITVVASGVSNQSTDTYVTVTLESGQEPQINPVSLSAQPLEPLDSYNFDYWKNILK